ncbi:MAG: polyprenol monophosphomannose synthase [Planctomycetota bacterium]
MRCLVVLPTYDERENVLPLVRMVLASSPDVDVLVVDDGSPDGTGRLVLEASAEEPRLELLDRGRKLGLGTAYLAGFRRAIDRGYALVATMDCDFSHHPRFLPDLLRGMADHDLVIGSRYVPGGGIANWPLSRRFLSGFANLYTRALLRLPVRDCTSGFRCYRCDVLERVDPWNSTASGYAFLEEMVWRFHRIGARIGETPILFEDRTRGRSKISRSEIWRAAAHVVRTAFTRPERRSGR